MNTKQVQHTPGPFHIGSRLKNAVQIFEPTGTRAIGETFGPNAEADAILFAAAPQLLAACKAVLAAETGAPNMIRAAVLKAEGGSK